VMIPAPWERALSGRMIAVMTAGPANGRPMWQVW